MAKNLWKCIEWVSSKCKEPCVFTDKQMNSDKVVCKKTHPTSWEFLAEDTCKYHDVIRCYDLSDCEKCPMKMYK